MPAKSQLTVAPPLIDAENDKPTVIALREIEQGLISPEVLQEIERDYEIVAVEESTEDAPQDAV